MSYNDFNVQTEILNEKKTLKSSATRKTIVNIFKRFGAEINARIKTEMFSRSALTFSERV